MLLNNLFFLLSLNSIDGSPLVKKPISLISLSILDNSHRDLRRARAAATNIVPTSTGAAKAVALVYPEMKGKLTGIAMRVPTPNVSAVDFVFESSKSVTAEEVNNALQKASLSSMKGIIKYGDEPLVSSDYAGTNESSIVDSDLTMCIGIILLRSLHGMTTSGVIVREL